jgi:hypothetical protein
MSVDAAIPDRFWPAVRWACTYVFSWVLPLIAVERFADNHPDVGALLSFLTLLVWFVAARWDRISELVVKRRLPMAFIIIGLSAVGLAAGILLLAADPRSASEQEQEVQWFSLADALQRFGSDPDRFASLEAQLKNGTLIARAFPRGNDTGPPVNIDTARWQFLSFDRRSAKQGGHLRSASSGTTTWVGVQIARPAGGFDQLKAERRESQAVTDRLTAERDKAIAEKNRTAARASQLAGEVAEAQRFAGYMRPLNVWAGFREAAEVWRALATKEVALLITAPAEHEQLRQYLYDILEIGARDVPNLTSGQVLPPDYNRDVDAPQLPPQSEVSGVVIHMHGEALPFLRYFLAQRGLEVNESEQVPDGLAGYYKRKDIIWIEIGKGPPWRGHS